MTWIAPKKRNKGSHSPRTHYSKEENRLEAVKQLGVVANMQGVPRDQNPQVSEFSRKAWFQGWDDQETKGD